MTPIKAIKKDHALITEMNESLSDLTSCVIWWLGQSGFLIQWNNHRLLLDPYLSDSLTKKYASTDKPHTRISELVIDPNLFSGINIVTSSHNHTDHLDAETLLPIIKNNNALQFVIPEANRAFVAERVGCAYDFPVGMNDGILKKIGAFSFYGVPAKHNEIDRDENGNCKYMGYVISFGPYKIYHSGDTLWFDDMIDILRPFNVDLAFLPINGNKPERRVAGNLDCKEAALLGKAIHARYVIPCHYDLFEFNTANVLDFEAEAIAIDQPFVTLSLGEKYVLTNAK